MFNPVVSGSKICKFKNNNGKDLEIEFQKQNKLSFIKEKVAEKLKCSKESFELYLHGGMLGTSDEELLDNEYMEMELYEIYTRRDSDPIEFTVYFKKHLKIQTFENPQQEFGLDFDDMTTISTVKEEVARRLKVKDVNDVQIYLGDPLVCLDDEQRLLELNISDKTVFKVTSGEILPNFVQKLYFECLVDVSKPILEIEFNSTDTVQNMVTEVSKKLKCNENEINIYLKNELLADMNAPLNTLINPGYKNILQVGLKKLVKFESWGDKPEMFELQFDTTSNSDTVIKRVEEYLGFTNLQIHLKNSKGSQTYFINLLNLNISDETVFSVTPKGGIIGFDKEFSFRTKENPVRDFKIKLKDTNTVDYIKTKVSDILQMPKEDIRLYFQNEWLHNGKVILGKLITEPNDVESFVVDFKKIFKFQACFSKKPEEFQLEIEPDKITKMGELIKEVRQHTGIKDIQISLGESQEALEDEVFLSALDISDKTVFKVTLTNKSVRVYNFFIEGEPIFKLDFDPNTATVKDVKERIAEERDIEDEANISLVYASKTLKDDAILKTLKIPIIGKIRVTIHDDDSIILQTVAALGGGNDKFSLKPHIFAKIDSHTEYANSMKLIDVTDKNIPDIIRGQMKQGISPYSLIYDFKIIPLKSKSHKEVTMMGKSFANFERVRDTSFKYIVNDALGIDFDLDEDLDLDGVNVVISLHDSPFLNPMPLSIQYKLPERKAGVANKEVHFDDIKSESSFEDKIRETIPGSWPAKIDKLMFKFRIELKDAGGALISSKSLTFTWKKFQVFTNFNGELVKWVQNLIFKRIKIFKKINFRQVDTISFSIKISPEAAERDNTIRNVKIVATDPLNTVDDKLKISSNSKDIDYGKVKGLSLFEFLDLINFKAPYVAESRPIIMAAIKKSDISNSSISELKSSQFFSLNYSGRMKEESMVAIIKKVMKKSSDIKDGKATLVFLKPKPGLRKDLVETTVPKKNKIKT